MTNINSYIKYPIGAYNDNITKYIIKFKDISNIHIKNIMNGLKNIELDKIIDLKNQVIIYGITTNTNLYHSSNFYFSQL